jgi:general secretion pathway protein E
VRTLCPQCRTLDAPTEGEARIVADLGLPANAPLATAPGCDACNQSGYRGRTGVYELLRVDDTMRRLIHDGAGELALRDAAVRSGMHTLRADGARWVATGATSLAELVRVTRDG